MGTISRELAEALGKWKYHRLDPHFDMQPMPSEFLRVLPSDYLATVAEYGGCEGFLGEQYIRLNRLEELLSLNQAYKVPEFAPQVLVFASTGGGESFAFDLAPKAVVRLPFIPLDMGYAQSQAASFAEFIQNLAASGVSSEASRTTLGKEVHEIKPILFGGSPTDPKNKILVDPRTHAQAACFFNELYRKTKNSGR